MAVVGGSGYNPYQKAPGYSNRMRQTLGNLGSKQNNLTAPGLGMSQAYDLFSGIQNAQQNYYQTLAQERYQMGLARAGFQSAQGQIGQAEKQGIVGAQAQAMDVEGLGSSVDLQNRIGVRATAASDTIAARNQMLQQITQGRMGIMGAQQGYQDAMQQAEMKQQMYMSQNALNWYQQYGYLGSSVSPPGTRGGPGAGKGGQISIPKGFMKQWTKYRQQSGRM